MPGEGSNRAGGDLSRYDRLVEELAGGLEPVRPLPTPRNCKRIALPASTSRRPRQGLGKEDFFDGVKNWTD